MKFLIAFAALLAVAYSEEVLKEVELPKAPIDTPEVQFARAAHFAAKFGALVRNGDVAPVVANYPLQYGFGPYYNYYGLPYGYNYGYVDPATIPAYPTTLGEAKIDKDGTPLETPEVIAAKTQLFAAHADALIRNGDVPAIHPYYASPYSYPYVYQPYYALKK